MGGADRGHGAGDKRAGVLAAGGGGAHRQEQARASGAGMGFAALRLERAQCGRQIKDRLLGLALKDEIFALFQIDCRLFPADRKLRRVQRQQRGRTHRRRIGHASRSFEQPRQRDPCAGGVHMFFAISGQAKFDRLFDQRLCIGERQQRGKVEIGGGDRPRTGLCREQAGEQVACQRFRLPPAIGAGEEADIACIGIAHRRRIAAQHGARGQIGRLRLVLARLRREHVGEIEPDSRRKRAVGPMHPLRLGQHGAQRGFARRQPVRPGNADRSLGGGMEPPVAIGVARAIFGADAGGLSKALRRMAVPGTGGIGGAEQFGGHRLIQPQCFPRGHGLLMGGLVRRRCAGARCAPFRRDIDIVGVRPHPLRVAARGFRNIGRRRRIAAVDQHPGERDLEVEAAIALRIGLSAIIMRGPEPGEVGRCRRGDAIRRERGQRQDEGEQERDAAHRPCLAGRRPGTSDND